MLIVPIHEAQPGMKLAASVISPENAEHELLKRGYTLDAAVIKRLHDLGIESLYVDYPGLEDLDRQLGPDLSPSLLKVYGQIKATIAAVQKTAQPTVGFADYYVAIREMVLTLLANGSHPNYIDLIASRLGNDAIHHAAAVSHLALTLGIRLHGYLITQRKRLSAGHATEVINIGVAGMLHDIGLAKLPEHIRAVSDTAPPANPALLAEWQSHCHLGYAMLRGGIESSAAAAVLNHHQRFDGFGFPVIRGHDGNRLGHEGQRIHVFARILSAADLFDNLAHPPGHSSRRCNATVHQLIETRFKQWLDPVIHRTLLATVPPYPPGTRVHLTAGQHAVVAAIDPDHPYQPTLRLVTPDGRLSDDPPICLTQPGAPQIVRHHPRVAA
ncbi:MAG: HD domain-containing phosphohydrolase [Tepidisphaeraceae bacterium]